MADGSRGAVLQVLGESREGRGLSWIPSAAASLFGCGGGGRLLVGSEFRYPPDFFTNEIVRAADVGVGTVRRELACSPRVRG